MDQRDFDQDDDQDQMNEGLLQPNSNQEHLDYIDIGVKGESQKKRGKKPKPNEMDYMKFTDGHNHHSDEEDDDDQEYQQ
jgi:hypothetical protein